MSLRDTLCSLYLDSGTSVPGQGKAKEESSIIIFIVDCNPGEGDGNPLLYSCLEIPWTEEPGGPQSMGLQRVRQDLATKH